MKALVLVVLLVAMPASAADSPLAGTYTSVPSDGAACILQVQASDAFLQRCGARPIVRGTVSRHGNVFSLQSDRLKAVEPDDAASHAAALATYMQWHFRQHGYYPVVLPPRVPEPPEHLGCGMVALHFADRVHLVDLFQRDAFCAAAKSGRQLSAVTQPHRVFVRMAQEGERTAVTWQEFCTDGWVLRPE